MVEMTDEARREVAERLRKGRENAAAARSAQTLSPEALFAAEHSGRSELAVEPVPIDESQQGVLAQTQNPADNTITRTGAGRVYMYRPGPFGWEPVLISTNAIGDCLKAGWKATCGDCGSPACGITPDGLKDANPNNCPGKEPRQLRRCPVCRKRVYDLDAVAYRDDGEETDPFEIADDAFSAVTPEARTKARLEEHIIAYHKTEARQWGLVQPNAVLTQAV